MTFDCIASHTLPDMAVVGHVHRFNIYPTFVSNGNAYVTLDWLDMTNADL